jgi:hypothetical protein
MSSSVCIATKAMEAYRSFIQVVPRHHQGQPNLQADLAATTLWMHKYMAAHPGAWWKVEEAQIVHELSGLPLTHEAREDIMGMVRCLILGPMTYNTLSSIPEE